MTVLLELDDVGCRRGDRLLFSGVTTGVDAGRLLRVRGANGAGKTTLLRMVCGLAAPSDGVVRWRGVPVGGQRQEFHLELVYLGHAPASKEELSALENLLASTRLCGLRCSQQEARDALAQAGLRGRENLPSRSLSQGQKKRAGLARLALSRHAALWVLDEPFSALDDAACDWLQGLIAAQLGRGGIVVMTSHESRGSWDAALSQVEVTLTAPSPRVPSEARNGHAAVPA